MQPGELVLQDLVVRDVLTRQAVAGGDRPFVRFGDEVATYASVHRNARLFSAALGGVGVRSGELVALMLPNSVEYVELYFALALLGAPVVLVNTSFRGYMLEYVLSDAACRTLVVDASYLEVLAESEDALPHLQSVLVIGDDTEIQDWSRRFSRLAVTALRALAADAELAASHDVAVAHGDLHCVVYSSGTTGPSKGIMISNAHALTKAVEVLRICEFTATDVLYSPLPLFYSMGLLRGVLSVALVGSSIVLRDRFSVSSFWGDVRTNGATVAHCVFSIPKMLAQAPIRADDSDNALRCMFNAQHDPALEARFGVKLIESYGLTEAGNAIYNRIGDDVVPGSCGRVSDDWEVRLADLDGLEVQPGDTGEILLRPRVPGSIMLGYLNKPEATAAAFRDLWLHTGDLARVDVTGHYFYQGRNKDVIRRRGQNISAWEVEEILRSHSDVEDVAAVSEPSDVGEDDLRVVLVATKPGALLDLVAIAAFCDERMPAFMVPRFYEQADELPKTPSGRVEKYKLEGSLAPGHLDRGSRRPAN